MKIGIKTLLVAVCLLACSINLHAQDTSIVNKGWNFLAEPYAMFPSMKGNVGIGTLPDATVDADVGDILSHLQMGAMVYLEASNGNWAVSSDLLYMNLKQDVSGRQNQFRQCKC